MSGLAFCEENGIGRLVFDLPGEKVNILRASTMEALSQTLDTLPSLRALVISSGKSGSFIAGADIHELEQICSSEKALHPSLKGKRIFDKLAALPFPTIALIDGACMGGGLEMALACTYRIVIDDPKTILALPEVSLGIIPGWGGTQRLPRLIGLPRALPLLLSGKGIPARQAVRIGLANLLVGRPFSQEAVEALLQSPPTKRPRGLLDAFLGKTGIGRALLFHQAKKELARKGGVHYPAPWALIDVLKGKESESEVFAKLACTEVSKNLISLFHVREALKKDPGSATPPRLTPITTTAVLGAGVMGGAIGWLLSDQLLNVRLVDLSWEAIGKALQTSASIYKQLTKLKKRTPQEVALRMHRITGCIDRSGLGNTDLVIEAVTENLSLKKELLATLEPLISSTTLIASNTSSLSITEMSRSLQHPERFLGIHFFNPVNRMPLVEVIPGESTDPEAISTAVSQLKKLDKIPIVVKDSPGFLVNRILFVYMNEALRMVSEGTLPQRIDAAFVMFGMPMGPLSLIDEVGIDVAYKVAKILETSLGARMESTAALETLHQAHLLGKKGGSGFYLYQGKNVQPNPQVQTLLNRPQRNKPDDLIQRPLLATINEAARCLDERIVATPAYLDAAMIFGTGFPPFRGGLLRYADTLGAQTIVNGLKNLADLHGPRLTPCPLLEQMAAQRRSFYG